MKFLKSLPIATLFSIITIVSLAQTNTNSILLDGTNDYIMIPNNSVLNPSNAITISGWIKADSWGVSPWDNYIVGKDNWDFSSTAGYTFRGGASGTLSFVFASGGLWQEVSSLPIMLTNVWYYVSATFNGTQIKVYINGVLEGTQNFSGTITPSTENLNIGRTPYWDSPSPRLFDGYLDQVEVWNVALSPAQINQYMLCSPIGNETGLVGFWNLEEGSGTVTSDQTSNGNNGTLMTGAAWSSNVQSICTGTSIAEQPETIFAKVAPNPVGNGITYIQIDAKQSADLKLEIMNGMGQVLQSEDWKLISGKNIVELNVSSLISGTYFMKLSGGEQTFFRKILITN